MIKEPPKEGVGITENDLKGIWKNTSFNFNIPILNTEILAIFLSKNLHGESINLGNKCIYRNNIYIQ